MSNFAIHDLKPKMAALAAMIVVFAVCGSALAQETNARPFSPATLAPGAKAMAAVFAPTGSLRVSINLGNPILANLSPATGKPEGVSVDLATELARRLGVPLTLVAVKSAGSSVDNVEQGKADVGFFAIDPERGQVIQFTKPYVTIEGVYAVPETSPITTPQQVDQEGVSVAVSKGSAYDLFLSRELHHATIVRITSASGVVQAFQDQQLNVAAGIRQQLEKDVKQAGDLRLLEPRFMVIRQAMGLPKSKGEDASTYLSQFVEEMKANGFVAAALARHHIEGASVAGADD